jgi:N-acetylglutamate synthase-like GNAT family acetyltransferase
MTLELRAVETEPEWAAMHDLRRRVLFAPGRHKIDVEYDANHPDDRAQNQVPHVLVLDGRVIGVARLDVRPDHGVVRLVAIEPDLQGQGYGRLMDAMLTEKGLELGLRELRVNAAPDAVGFYEECGWQRDSWSPEELTGIAADCVQMTKPLG